MVENLTFRIGSISIGLVGSKDWQYSGQEPFQQFLSAAPPQASYSIKTSPIPVKPLKHPVFETGRGWCLYADQGRKTIWAQSQYRNPLLVGSFTPDFESGEIFTTESTLDKNKYSFPFNFPMGELVIINLLGNGNGLMLHSCSVVDGDSGIVFAGYGSAGKSTTSRLWNNLDGVKVLNDDHNIVRKINGQFRVFGTPWHGQGGIARPDDAHIKKMFILKHAADNKAVLLSPAKAAAELLVRTFAPLWSTSAMAFTLQFLDELCHAVPCYELGFVPDQSAVEYVRCLPSAWMVPNSLIWPGGF
jgi:hypothetical protein